MLLLNYKNISSITMEIKLIESELQTMKVDNNLATNNNIISVL